MYRTKIPQLRTIPVRKSIADSRTYNVGSYDDVRRIFSEASGHIAVFNCICRQNRNVIGEKCSKTELHETCFAFGELADKVIAAQIARVVSPEEGLAILDKAQADGLVVQPENAQKPSYVCCCCGDCCGILTTVKRFPNPSEMYASNFYAQVDPEACVGCETCVKNCQLGAITLVNEVAQVDIERCIGCGNCVACCSSGANHLVKKQTEIVPPKDTNALYMKIMSKKVGKWNMLKMGTKIMLKQQV